MFPKQLISTLSMPTARRVCELPAGSRKGRPPHLTTVLGDDQIEEQARGAAEATGRLDDGAQ